jgi:hypothetical protein
VSLNKNKNLNNLDNCDCNKENYTNLEAAEDKMKLIIVLAAFVAGGTYL